ncbi:MAG: protein kinase family protein [Muribaculaceae bacterium]|nr:protein kinase family protein [Muribaculaceae bacterium]
MEKLNDVSGFGFDFEDEWEEESDGNGEEIVCGRGAGGIVYQMRLRGLRVAVKRLRPELTGNPLYVNSYRKEWMIGRQLKHEGLPMYRDACLRGEDIYIVMEYVDGATLEDFVHTDEGSRYFRRKSNVREFFSKLIEILGYLHRNGVIHCDIKASNVMLRHSDRSVILIDLDKAYSDALDMTHGGTEGISNPLPAGEIPTIHKDYEGVGRLIDYLSENVEGFPRAEFRRLRRECVRRDATRDNIVKALNPARIPMRILLPALIIMLATGMTIYLHKMNDSESPEVVQYDGGRGDSMSIKPLGVAQADESRLMSGAGRDGNAGYGADGNRDEGNVTDKVSAAKMDSDKSGSAPGQYGISVNSQIKSIGPEYDILVAMIDQMIKRSWSKLKSGTMSDEELYEMTRYLSLKYVEHSNSIVEAYKRANPDIADIDIRIEVARRNEKSGLTNRYTGLTDALSDTIMRRHKKYFDNIDAP